MNTNASADVLLHQCLSRGLVQGCEQAPDGRWRVEHQGVVFVLRAEALGPFLRAICSQAGVGF